MRSGKTGLYGSSGPVAIAMTQMAARLLLAPSLIAAIAILLKGYTQPDDAFSAGAVAAIGIAMQYLAFGRAEAEHKLPVRGIGKLSLIGLLALTVALTPLFLGDPILTEHPPPGADVIYVGSIELITAFAFDFGVFLAVLGYATGLMSLVSRVVEHSWDAAKEYTARESGHQENAEEGRRL